MTGFGEAEGANGLHRITVTLRSVNSRYLDIDVKLADEYLAVEERVRERIEQDVRRGRVEARVRVVPLVPPQVEVQMRERAVEALSRVSRDLVDREIVGAGLTVGDLVQIPGVVDVEVTPGAFDDDDVRLLDDLLDRALERMSAARRREGEKLKAALHRQLEILRTAIDDLVGQSDELRESTHRRLRERLVELLGDRELDEVRLAQEVAILVDKGDVTEELDRLAAHVQHFDAAMEEEGGVGKRLDFLSQEILRELNTVAAKCDAAATTRTVLDAKVACEQLREQIRNVE